VLRYCSITAYPVYSNPAPAFRCFSNDFHNQVYPKIGLSKSGY